MSELKKTLLASSIEAIAKGVQTPSVVQHAVHSPEDQHYNTDDQTTGVVKILPHQAGNGQGLSKYPFSPKGDVVFPNLSKLTDITAAGNTTRPQAPRKVTLSRDETGTSVSWAMPLFDCGFQWLLNRASDNGVVEVDSIDAYAIERGELILDDAGEKNIENVISLGYVSHTKQGLLSAIKTFFDAEKTAGKPGIKTDGRTLVAMVDTSLFKSQKDYSNADHLFVTVPDEFSLGETPYVDYKYTFTDTTAAAHSEYVYYIRAITTANKDGLKYVVSTDTSTSAESGLAIFPRVCSITPAQRAALYALPRGSVSSVVWGWDGAHLGSIDATTEPYRRIYAAPLTGTAADKITVTAESDNTFHDTATVTVAGSSTPALYLKLVNPFKLGTDTVGDCAGQSWLVSPWETTTVTILGAVVGVVYPSNLPPVLTWTVTPVGDAPAAGITVKATQNNFLTLEFASADEEFVASVGSVYTVTAKYDNNTSSSLDIIVSNEGSGSLPTIAFVTKWVNTGLTDSTNAYANISGVASDNTLEEVETCLTPLQEIGNVASSTIAQDVAMSIANFGYSNQLGPTSNLIIAKIINVDKHGGEGNNRIHSVTVGDISIPVGSVKILDSYTGALGFCMVIGIPVSIPVQTTWDTAYLPVTVVCMDGTPIQGIFEVFKVFSGDFQYATIRKESHYPYGRVYSNVSKSSSLSTFFAPGYNCDYLESLVYDPTFGATSSPELPLQLTREEAETLESVESGSTSSITYKVDPTKPGPYKFDVSVSISPKEQGKARDITLTAVVKDGNATVVETSGNTVTLQATTIGSITLQVVVKMPQDDGVTVLTITRNYHISVIYSTTQDTTLGIKDAGRLLPYRFPTAHTGDYNIEYKYALNNVRYSPNNSPLTQTTTVTVVDHDPIFNNVTVSPQGLLGGRITFTSSNVIKGSTTPLTGYIKLRVSNTYDASNTTPLIPQGSPNSANYVGPTKSTTITQDVIIIFHIYKSSDPGPISPTDVVITDRYINGFLGNISNTVAFSRYSGVYRNGGLPQFGNDELLYILVAKFSTLEGSGLFDCVLE